MQRTVRDHRLFLNEEAQWDAFWESFTKHNFAHWMDFVHHRGPHKSILDVLRSSFRDSLQMSPSMHNDLSDTYWNYFCNTCHFEEGAEEVLHSVRTSYKLGIISNGVSEAQRKRLRAGNVFELFQSIVVSDEAGVRKPRKEIFDISLQELKLDHREVLFVGDSLNDDYHGALNAGIDFCFYNRKKDELPSEIRPKHTIDKLQDLLQII